MSAAVFFEDAAAFRRWLQRHAGTAAELIVGYYKVDSGRPSITWPESVDEALCFGWIDGVRKRIDDASYLIRFTPRKTTSIWSAINIAHVERLTAAGLMHPAGLAAYARRSPERSAVYSYETRDQLDDGELAAIAAVPAAQAFWSEATPMSGPAPRQAIARI